jgi:hypothetical protein
MELGVGKAPNLSIIASEITFTRWLSIIHRLYSWLPGKRHRLGMVE